MAMFLDIKKKNGKVTKMLLKKHSFHKNNAFIRNVIKFVPDVIFLFCFHLQQANTLQFFFSFVSHFPSVNCSYLCMSIKIRAKDIK